MSIYIQPETTAAERASLYRPGKFCPVHLGDVLNDRYHIFRKLGYGGTSTVWLARDKLTSKYVAVKVYSATARVDLLVDLESSPHVEHAWDRFTVHSIYGKHICVVLEPVGRDIRSILDVALSIDDEDYGEDTPEHLRKYIPRQWMTTFTREVCRQLLVGLSDLHKQQIVHRDMAPGNLMLALSYDLNHMSIDEIQADIWSNSDSEKLLAQQETSVAKESQNWDDMNLSRSQWSIAPIVRTDGQPSQIGDLKYLIDPCSLHDKTIINEQAFRLLIIDLGLARRFDDLDHPMSEQANCRPPEQILPIRKTHYSDIFSAGLVMWEIVMNRNLVWSSTRKSGIGDKRENDNDQYLKDLEIRLGPMPMSFQHLWKFRNDLELPEDEEDLAYGDLAFAAKRDRPASMSDTEVELFVDFIKQALQWEPERRLEAAQLLEHEWFRYKSETKVTEGTTQAS